MQFYILPNTVKHKFGDPIPRQTRICLVGAKGERVAFQAILPQAFPCVKLTSDGTWKTQIFWEKYVDVAQPSSQLTAAGKYPDVMVETGLAEARGENSSECGEGLIWCFADIPATAEPGRYTLTLTAEADGERAFVQAEIEVMDFSLPIRNGNVTSFAIREDMIRGKGAIWRAKYEALVEEHLKYRLSPTKLVPYGQWEQADVLAAAKKMTADDRCAAYSLPYKSFLEDTIYEKGQECLDVTYLTEVLTLLAENSTDECNLLKKANFYITFIDEPTPEKFHSVRRVYREIYEAKREVAKAVDFSDRREVENSLLTLDNIVTVFQKEPIYGEVDTWCPTFWGYFKPEYVYEAEKLRGLGKKNWWYGCVAPHTPFPNLHTDSPMRDSRFESWLRFAFDIIGNLYWATNLTKKYDESKKAYTDCDVLRETLLFPGACGDGLLFYTETEYNAPLPSLRLFSMFLGLQEYEYFLAVDRAAHAAQGYYLKKMDAREMLESFFLRIAKGTMLIYDFDVEALRRELGGHVVFAENNLFTECKAGEKRNFLCVYSPVNAEVICDGRRGEESLSGKGKRTCFFLAHEVRFAEIDVSLDGKHLKLRKFIDSPRKYLPLTHLKSNTSKIECGKALEEKGTYVRLKPFVNEEQPSVFLPFPANLAEINRIEVETQSFSEDALVLNTVLKDSSGGRYWPGYGIIRENGDSKISVAVTRLTQNRLNSDTDAVPSERVKENAAAAAAFDFENVAGIELVFGNNVKLLDDNRERRRAEYSFLLKSVSITFFEKQEKYR